MISDMALVARVTGSNDQSAFQQLVERHQAAIRGFLGRLLKGDRGTADDLGIGPETIAAMSVVQLV